MWRNIIKEPKVGIGMEQMPGRTFEANTVHFTMGIALKCLSHFGDHVGCYQRFGKLYGLGLCIVHPRFDAILCRDLYASWKDSMSRASWETPDGAALYHEQRSCASLFRVRFRRILCPVA